MSECAQPFKTAEKLNSEIRLISSVTNRVIFIYLLFLRFSKKSNINMHAFSGFFLRLITIVTSSKYQVKINEK
jgi:hypothetical protein